jgi:hypothetical protein
MIRTLGRLRGIHHVIVSVCLPSRHTNSLIAQPHLPLLLIPLENLRRRVTAEHVLVASTARAVT